MCDKISLQLLSESSVLYCSRTFWPEKRDVNVTEMGMTTRAGGWQIIQCTDTTGITLTYMV